MPFVPTCHRLRGLTRWLGPDDKRSFTMRRLMLAVVVAASGGNVLAADVGVSVTVGQPGYYGRIDIGNFPQPQLLYAQPVVIERVPTVAVPQPVCLHVPPGHAKNWRKHCGRYNACGEPVYFVSDNWYNNVYAKGHAKGDAKGKGKKQKKD